MSFFKNIFKSKNSIDNLQKTIHEDKNESNGIDFDINKPVENPKLVELLKEFKLNGNNTTLSNVYEEVAMKAKFLTIVKFSINPTDNGDGTSTFQQSSVMTFFSLTSKDNQNYLPIFTDWNEVYKWKEVTSPKTLIMGFDDVHSIVSNGNKYVGVVINPFGENHVIMIDQINFIKNKKESIEKGYSTQVVKEATQVFLGEPKNYPSEMVNAIKDYLSKNYIIDRVWLRLMTKNNESSLLLVIDSKNDRDFVFKSIIDIAKPYLGNMFLDMIMYNDSNERFVNNVEPFYNKNLK